MAVYIALWDCPTCERKGNLGPQTKCTGCGASRPRNVRFYLPEAPILVENEADLRKANSGADWVCRHCDAHNKAWESICNSCGNPRDAAHDVSLQQEEFGLEDVPQSGERPRELNTHEKKYLESKKSPNRTLPILIAFAIFLGLGMYLFSVESTINVKITGFEWARSLQLEHYEPVQKEDWSLPQGAYNVSNFQGIHHYDKVLQGYVTRTRWVKVPSGTRRYVCGKTSTGNGYYQDRYCTETTYRDKQESYQDPVYRDVPVYRTKYRFDIKTWVEKDVLRTTQKNQTPVWAQSENLKQEGWREGKKEETYWLYIKDPDENIHKEKVPFSRWTKYKLHADIPARKRWITGKYLGLEEKKE